MDLGHSHTDAGHRHEYSFLSYFLPVPGGAISARTVEFGEPEFDQTANSYADIQVSYANISLSSANIEMSHAAIGEPRGSRTASETRPSNMRVTWIIKVNHEGTD